MRATWQLLSKLSFWGGILSILASLIIWFWGSFDDTAYGQRLALFIGLWPVTFFALVNYFDRLASAESPTSREGITGPIDVTTTTAGPRPGGRMPAG
jgi:hypothetical protein